MRTSAMIVAIAAGACSPTLVRVAPLPPPATPAITPVPQGDWEAPAGCTAGAGNEIITRVDESTPIVVLDEYITSCFGRPPPSPKVAIWADGRIRYWRQTRPDAREHPPTYEQLDASLSRAEVDRIVRDVAGVVHDSPRHVTLTTEQPGSPYSSAVIAVRDGSHWYGASVAGAFERDFLAVASPSSLPRPFARAYRELLNARPRHGHAPEDDYDYDVEFTAIGTYYNTHNTGTIAWPSDLPEPPPTMTPAGCGDAGIDDHCWFRIAPAFSPMVRRFDKQVRAGKEPRLVIVNGQTFLTVFRGLYRGERGVRALEACNARLDAGP